jgi:transcription initiation factor TFIID subunit 5
MSNTPPVPNNTQASNSDQLQAQQQQQQQQQQAAAAAAAAATAGSATHTPADIDKMVASYLQKKGYKATEAIFSRESKGEAVSVEDVQPKSNDLMTTTTTTSTTDGQKNVNKTADSAKPTSPSLGNEDQEMEEANAQSDQASGGDPDIYDISYKSLREWIENSLDWYKVTFRKVFVDCN